VTATTVSRESRPSGLESAHFAEYPVKALEAIEEGTIVAKDASGWAISATSDSAEVVLGMADELLTGLASGGLVRVKVRKGTYEDLVLTYDKVNDGVKVYVTDNQTVNTTVTASPCLGVQVGPGLGGSTLSRIWISPCLLYTSPSPRDATLSRMPSSA